MKLLAAFFLLVLTAGAGSASTLWINNITVNENGMTWSYDEKFTGSDSKAFRNGIDARFGDNDSFVNAWEVLRADKELRRELRSSIDREMDVRIDNETYGIEVVDVDAALSPDIIGKTDLPDAIVNRYTATYRFKDSILNAGSIWFMGRAKTPVTILIPAGVDAVNVSGLENATMTVTDHTEISGFFKQVSADRGEITLALAKNSSFIAPEVNTTDITSQSQERNDTKPVIETLSRVRDASIVIIGLILILAIYFFKVRRH